MDSAASHRHRSRVGFLALAGLLLLGAACQGDFAPPVLDSPRDPANGLTPPPPSISDLTVFCAGDEPQIRVQWTVVETTGLSGFQIYRSRSTGEDPGTLVASVPADRRDFLDGAAPGIPGLSPNSVYYYRVRALGVDGVPGLRSQPSSRVTSTCP